MPSSSAAFGTGISSGSPANGSSVRGSRGAALMRPARLPKVQKTPADRATRPIHVVERVFDILIYTASAPTAAPVLTSRIELYPIKVAPLARRQRRARPWEARPPHAGPRTRAALGSRRLTRARRPRATRSRLPRSPCPARRHRLDGPSGRGMRSAAPTIDPASSADYRGGEKDGQDLVVLC